MKHPQMNLLLQLVDERMKQASDPVFRRVGELCALLASRTEMEIAGNSETSGLRRNHESFRPSRNRYDSLLCQFSSLQ